MGLSKEWDIDISILPWEEAGACCSQGDVKGADRREGVKQTPPASVQGKDAHGHFFTVLSLSKVSILVSL